MIGILKTVGTASFAFLALAILGAEAIAQSETQTTVNTTGWGVQCNSAENGLQCAATISMVSAPDNQRIISVSFQEAGEDANPTLIVQLPFGLNLIRGIDMSVDGTELGTLQVNTCLQAGCFIVQEADQPLLDAMVGGETLTVTMETSSGNTTQMQMALDGFSDALNRLE